MEEQRGVSLLMSFGYLACVYRDIQRCIAQYLDFEQFKVSSVKLEPPLKFPFINFPFKRGNFAHYSGDGLLHYYAATGVLVRSVRHKFPKHHTYVVVEDELVFAEAGKIYNKTFGWITSHWDGCYVGNEKLYTDGRVTPNGNIFIIDRGLVTFPNGTTIPLDGAIYATDAFCYCHDRLRNIITILTLSGFCLFRGKIAFSSSVDVLTTKMYILYNNVYEIYDFSIFSDASGPGHQAE